MDTELVRQVSQVALTVWALVVIVALIISNGRLNTHRAMWFGVAGLWAFALWQFLGSISIGNSSIIQRKNLTLYFAIVESITAGAAWSWLIIALRYTFRFRLRMNHGLNGNGNGNGNGNA